MPDTRHHGKWLASVNCSTKPRLDASANVERIQATNGLIHKDVKRQWCFYWLRQREILTSKWLSVTSVLDYQCGMQNLIARFSVLFYKPLIAQCWKVSSPAFVFGCFLVCRRIRCISRVFLFCFLHCLSGTHCRRQIGYFCFPVRQMLDMSRV